MGQTVFKTSRTEKLVACCELPQPKWYWKSAFISSEADGKDVWRKYLEIESEIIEEAYSATDRTKLIEFDEYFIDLDQFFQLIDSMEIIKSPFKDWARMKRQKMGTAIANALKVNGTRTSLELWYNQLPKREAAVIADASKWNKTLAILNLLSSKLSKTGGVAIGQVLKISEARTCLYLGWNRLGERRWSHYRRTGSTES